MDPLSHGLMGLAAFSLKYSPSLSNPACLGAVIGAIAPDFDIMTRIKGDYVYLKHHRVESHSIPGILFSTLVITAGLSLFFSEFYFYQVFFWTLLGSLSHIVLDIFNSYGASILYPLTRKKYSLNLLMIYDPVLTILNFYIIMFRPRSIGEYGGLGSIMLVYLLYKSWDRKQAKQIISQHYEAGYRIKSVDVMPGEWHPLKWHYIINTSSHHIVGDVNPSTGKIDTPKKLRKIQNAIINKALEDELADYFKGFTPFFHIDLIEESRDVIVRMVDLRYRVKEEFKHHVSFYYDEHHELMRSIFHPFKLENTIEIYSKKSVDAH
ncbi:membrane-bound metal-dependent hydrolase [Alkaliphilus metalliredigens QYMF]|uniref:Membrane-bound metal-dependent hydrolase n=1 Tax=Alkaliphilus metalliredigens (strain QYMF) TaxID=293826 RepID=A6TSU9_ALKMQ|nr:metal-dependent hydrolase [Alkaliphilus metalliredigens]ABR49267.1 membrane-bound metal-dependent hydrolase [Alkaliphilus metalliredigens QYMF]